MKNIFKKFIVLFSLVFILFGYNFVFAISDTVPPVITITGSNPIDLTVGGTFTDPGATAIDDTDGPVTPITSGSVDMNTIGNYVITYTATDNALNVSTLTRTVNVKALPVLNSIAITTPATKLSYAVGDSLDIGGLVITGTYDSGPTQVENIQLSNITGFDSSKVASNQILTITDGEKTTTYTVNIVSTPVTINLKVYAGDTVLFDGPETVTACPESLEVDAPITVNGKCAIEQSGLSNTWTWYDSSFSKDSSNPKTLGVLDELGGSSKNDTDYIYWGWFNDLNYGATAINKHLLTNGEEFLLTYNSHPMKISSDITSGKVGDTITLKAEEKTNFNSDWSDLIWTPLKDATIKIGDQSCMTIDDGTCSIVLNKIGTLSAIGSKSLYVPSNILGIEISDNIVNSGGGGNTPAPVIFNVQNAIAYLSSVQDANGSFGNSDLYTDWVAIAASADNNSNLKSSILNYLKSNPVQSSFITDYERRAMALMALGVNPYDGTEINYIQKIIDSFDGVQFGDSNLVNDDIFALIPLANAGYTDNDLEIKKDISFIVSKQDVAGSWGSVDLTAAGIEALYNFRNISDASGAIDKAYNYIISSQSADGGFGNSDSTSWAVQALSLNSSSYISNIDKAINYLAEKQQSDGGLNDVSNTVDNRIWSTSYTIPAVLKLSWNNILNNFNKPIIISSSNSVDLPTEKVIDTAQPIIQVDPEVTVPKVILDLPQKVIKKNIIAKKNNTNKPIEVASSVDIKDKTSINNNLTASALNAIPSDFSLKEIPKTIVNFMVNVIHSIGNSFYHLLSLIYVF